MEKAILACGCFWGVQSAFETVAGVLSTRVGFTGGKVPEPSYMEVASGRSGHAEAIEITFDPKEISFSQLLDVFFDIHDPTQLNRQGVDVGSQYRSAVFYLNDKQKKAAIEKIAALRKLNHYQGDIVTEVTAATVFYPAEEFHQHYHAKRGITACKSTHCGRRGELL